MARSCDLRERAPTAPVRGIPMTRFPVTHSVPTPASIAALVTRAYDVGRVESCRFLERGLNDTFALTAETAQYVLRCYRAGWRRSQDIAYELEALIHLHGRGVAVAAPCVDATATMS